MIKGTTELSHDISGSGSTHSQNPDFLSPFLEDDPDFNPQSAFQFLDGAYEQEARHSEGFEPGSENEVHLVASDSRGVLETSPGEVFSMADFHAYQVPSFPGQDFAGLIPWQNQSNPVSPSTHEPRIVRHLHRSRELLVQAKELNTSGDALHPSPGTQRDSIIPANLQNMLEKSERARNAANQRHARSRAYKRSFKDGGLENDGDDDEDDGSGGGGGANEQQKEKSREKNKVAAAKCRAKKRNNVEKIEYKHLGLSAENSSLKRQEQQLRETVAQLRTIALAHHDCHCGIHHYNIYEARKLALGLGCLASSTRQSISTMDTILTAVESRGQTDVDMLQSDSISSATGTCLSSGRTTFGP